MATYVILNLFVMGGLAAIVFLKKPAAVWISRQKLSALAVLIILTAVFDNILISTNIVAYNPDALLGLYVGLAPIEDFAYTVVASIFIPYVWERSIKK